MILNKIVACQFVSARLVLLTFHVTFSEKNKVISKIVKYTQTHNSTLTKCFSSSNVREKVPFLSPCRNKIEINRFFCYN